jgi:Flp pilus assembly protein TadG
MRSESGQTTMFLALVMGLIMCGFMALAVDMGHLFAVRRQAQAAADAAALAAAEEINDNTSDTTASSEVINAANVAATQNGFSGGTVTLSQSTSGNYLKTGTAVPSTWVTATVSAPIQTYFLSVFNRSSTKVTVGASATAAAGAPASTCICLTGSSGNDLNMSNDAKLNAVGCGVTVDSTSANAITVVGSASVCGTTVGAAANPWGGSSYINNAGTICPAAKQIQGAAPCSSSIVTPIQPAGLNGTCKSSPIYGYVLYPGYNGNYTLPYNGASKAAYPTPIPIANDTIVNNSVCYNSFNLANAASVQFTSGITYFINGDFTTGGGETITGTNVSFIITGNLSISNGTTLNLTAPTVNGAPGVLFYLPNASSTVSIQGGSNSNFSGIVYAPNSTVNIANGTGTNTYADFVAKTLTMAGGATVNNYATTLIAGAGGGAGTAMLVQ